MTEDPTQIVRITLASRREPPHDANLVVSPENFMKDTDTGFEDWDWSHGEMSLEEAMKLPTIATAIRMGLIHVEEVYR